MPVMIENAAATISAKEAKGDAERIWLRKSWSERAISPSDGIGIARTKA